MRPHLVVVRAGPGSLHPSWVAGARERSFDLVVAPYAPGTEPGDRPELAEVRPGWKFSGLAALLGAWRGWRDYAYVWLPDDDLATDAAAIDRFLAGCRGRDALLAAPALSERSSASHLLTLVNHAFVARETTFVEVMAPCFRADVLERLLPTFSSAPSGLGWGLDEAWPHLLGHRGVWILDEVTMDHLRPVGFARDRAALEEALAELVRTRRRYRAAPLYKTVAGWDAAGRRHSADEPGFVERYVEGYRWRIAADPRVEKRLRREQAKDVAAWARAGGRPGLGRRLGRGLLRLLDRLGAPRDRGGDR